MIGVTAVVQFADDGEGLRHRKVRVRRLYTRPMVEVRAARQIRLRKELWQGIA